MIIFNVLIGVIPLLYGPCPFPRLIVSSKCESEKSAKNVNVKNAARIRGSHERLTYDKTGCQPRARKCPCIIMLDRKCQISFSD